MNQKMKQQISKISSDNTNIIGSYYFRVLLIERYKDNYLPMDSNFDNLLMTN